MIEFNNVCFLLPTGKENFYDFAASILESTTTDESIYLHGIFAISFKKGETYTIKAFNGKSKKTIDLPLNPIDKECKMFMVQDNLPVV